MRIKCIALDLDGTTLNSQGHLSERNRQMIEQAVEAGIEVAVASGRSLHSLPDEVTGITGIRYAVTSNGAAVYDLKEQKCLRQYKMTADSVIGILACISKESIALETFIDGKPYAEQAYVKDPVRFGATAQSVGYIQGTRKPVEGMEEFILCHREELDCIDIIVKSEEQKQTIWKILQQQVDDVYITSSVRQLLEISHVNAGKDTAAEFLARRLGIRREELAAFGDGHNDCGMLKYAGIGFAVANASEECRNAADRITASNDDDGVAEGIGYILRLNEK